MTEFIATAKNIKMFFYSDKEKTQVIHDVSVQIPEGKITMLVGPSGCGKTTLISILTGMLTPSSGDVYYKGKKLSSLSETEKAILRRKEFGLVFQQYNLIDTLTAAENVAIPLLAEGMKFDTAIRHAVRVLQTLNLGDRADFMPAKLSGGEQQRVAVARGLVHNPNLVVCDEPTAALDAKNGKNIIALLSKIAKEKQKSVLIVTHDNRIFDYADLIIHMDDGRIEKEEDKPGKQVEK